MKPLTVLRGLQVGDIGWVAHRQGILYALEYGWDGTFEALVAEIAAQYLKKGSKVYIEGRLQTSSWEDKQSGEKKYRTEVVADRIQFGPRGGTAGGSSAAGSSKGSAAAVPPVEKGAVDTIEYPEEQINPEDIPF